MAEIVGLVASITNLTEIAIKITGLSYTYFNDVKNGPKIQKQYLQEVSAFTDILFRASQALDEAEATKLLPSRPRSLSDDILRDCHNTLSSLQNDLERRINKLLWPFHEKEFKKHIESLRRFRGIFDTFISANIL